MTSELNYINPNLDIDVYHGMPGISNTGISLILDCPKRYWHEYMAPKSIDPKEAQKQRDKYKLGRAVHMFVLEPEKFSKTFYVMQEEVNLTTKIGKETWAKAETAANGLEIIRYKDWLDIRDMAMSVRTHSLWEKMKERKVEHSIFWQHELFNVGLKARPDAFNDMLIVDLKTTDSISSFRNSIYNYGYHRQAALQIDGLKAIDGIDRQFAFFVVEKKAPYLTGCFLLNDTSIMQGRREYLDGAAIYAQCLSDNSWPGYEEKFQEISIPEWAIKKETDSNF